jgi:hypothetical protein
MKALVACLFAAVISFGWGFASWMLIGWHSAGMYSFKDESAVAAVIKANVTRGQGIYVLPGIEGPPSYATPEEKRKFQERHVNAYEGGPYIYATVRPGTAEWSMGRNLAASFARSLLAAIMVAMILRSTVAPYAGRVAISALAGVFAALVSEGTSWIWFEYPNRELVVNLADHFAEWLLAGLVLAAFFGRDPTANEVG